MNEEGDGEEEGGEGRGGEEGDGGEAGSAIIYHAGGTLGTRDLHRPR